MVSKRAVEVSLWFSNDESLYRLARHYVRRHTKNQAAEMILSDLTDLGITQTPNGVPYSISSIRYALRAF